MNGLKDAINGIEQAAKKAIQINSEDYIKDGLIYCGRCRTPKQCRIEIFGEVRTPMCLCKCEAEKRERQEEENKRNERIIETYELKKMGFPDAEMQKWTFDKDDGGNERVIKIAKNYVNNFAEMKRRGKGLLFYGPVGTGKTFAGACIANALIYWGVPCLVTNFPRLINAVIKKSGGQDYIDSLNRFDLLVIDDLASERETEYMTETVQYIIDARYRSGLPLIVTTNLSAEELKHPADVRKQRVYSRLFEMCVPVEVTGADRRKERLLNEFEELKKILEI